jgi:hypothetical protein
LLGKLVFFLFPPQILGDFFPTTEIGKFYFIILFYLFLCKVFFSSGNSTNYFVANLLDKICQIVSILRKDKLDPQGAIEWQLES